MMRLSLRHALIPLLLSLFLLEGVAHAQESDTVELSPTQRRYNNQGVKLMAAEKYEEALATFKSSLALGEANITHLNLGRTYQRLGRCAEAKQAYARVVKAPKVKSPAPEEIDAVLKRYSSELPETCPTSLQLACTPAEVSVSIDSGDAMACPDESIDVQPGSHTIVATLGDRRTERTVEVEEGTHPKVELDLTAHGEGGDGSDQPTDVQADATTTSPAESSSLGTVGWIVTGTGVALLGTALVLDQTYVADRVTALEDAAAAGGDTATAKSDLESAQTTNFIVLGTGAAATVVGSILLLWPEDDEANAASVWSDGRSMGISWHGSW